MLSIAKARKDYYLQNWGRFRPVRTTTCEVEPPPVVGTAAAPPNRD